MPLIRTLVLLMLALSLTACASKQPVTNIEPSETLPTVKAQSGQPVFVEVRGGTDSVNEDLRSMLAAYLQSERGLSPAERHEEARIVVVVNLGDTVALGTRDKPMSGTQGLAGAATGAGLGALLGSAAGSYRGTGIGAGIGALLGLGVVWLDNKGKNNAWAMRAKVGISNDGSMPEAKDTRALVVTAAGAHMDEKEILPGLEDALCQKIVEAIQQ